MISVDLDYLFNDPPHHRLGREGLYRCLVCEVGGCDTCCWLCGSPMERGDITRCGCYVKDTGMDAAKTDLEPGRRDELKTLDDLVRLPGEPEFHGVFNPEVRFLKDVPYRPLAGRWNK